MKTISPFQFALLAPHIAPKLAAPPGAAAALLELRELLQWAGWSPGQARADVRNFSKPRKETTR
jgi:hypothetical protein